MREISALTEQLSACQEAPSCSKSVILLVCYSFHMLILILCNKSWRYICPCARRRGLWGNGNAAPLICKMGARWRCVGSFTPPPLQWTWRLADPRAGFDVVGKKEMSVPTGNRTVDWPVRSLFTVSTGPVSQILRNKREQVKQDAGLTEHVPRTAALLLVENGILSSLARLYVFIHTPSIVGLDSSVGISTRHRLDAPGIESWWEARFSATVQTDPGGPPASYTMGTGSFQGVKRPRRGAEHQSI